MTSAPQEFSAAGMAVRTAATLFFFVIVFTGLLSGAYLWTKPAIEASAAEEKMKLVDEVLPRGEYDNALLADTLTLPNAGPGKTGPFIPDLTLPNAGPGNTGPYIPDLNPPGAGTGKSGPFIPDLS